MTVARTSDQEAADKLAWSLQVARASILHACSPHASTQDTPIYLHLFVRSSEWAGNARARWSLGRRTRPYAPKQFCLRAGVHAPIKSVSVPAAISVVLIFHVSLWPRSTRGRPPTCRRDDGDLLHKYAGTARRAGAHSSSM